MTKKKKKIFNLVVTGTGGQGILTLARIVAQAALLSGQDVKMAEVHGLAQRGGHVDCQIRIGEKVHSSLVSRGEADLIVALEPLEVLRCLSYAGPQTKFLINTAPLKPLSCQTDGVPYPELKQILKEIKGISREVIAENASQQVLKISGDIFPLNIYLLGRLVKYKFLSFKKKYVLDGLKQSISPKYLAVNQEVFETALNNRH